MKRIILAALFVAPLLLNAQTKNQETPLKPEQVKKENAATAVKEKEVAAEKSEAETALAQGKEIEVKSTTQTYTATSVAENSGYANTATFNGTWKLDLDLTKNEIIITGGSIQNTKDKASNNLRLMVYYADKPFDLQNPNLIGSIFSSVDIEPIPAKGVKESQSFVAPVLVEKPAAGKYYPYIIIGELNPATQQYEFNDVKVFKEFISLP